MVETRFDTGTRPLEICLIIPAYNEVENIGHLIRETLDIKFEPNYKVKILVVDGGSNDGTPDAAVASGASVIRQRKKGYGDALYSGFQEASQADIIVFMDGDYSDPPAAIPEMITALLKETGSIVLGSRTLGISEKGALLFHQVWGNRLVTFLMWLVYRQKLSDLPSLKAVHRELLFSFDMQEMTYGFTVELLVKAIKSGCKIIEIPINYRSRHSGKSKVSGSLKGSVLSAYFLIKTVFHYYWWKPQV